MKPSNLDLPKPSDFALEVALSLQHAHRILRALQESRSASWKIAYQSVIIWLVELGNVPRLRRLRDAIEIVSLQNLSEMRP